MIARKQSTTTYPVQFLMVDSTDHVTAETGLSPTVTISKNGGAYGAASGAVTEVGNGVYSYAGNATDRDTLGELMIHAEATGADKVDMKVLITSYDPFVDIAAILADTGTDGVKIASAQTVATVTNLTNLPTMPNDWLTAAGVKADAVTKIQNGLALAGDEMTLTGSTVTAIQSGLALEATLTAIKGAGWTNETLCTIQGLINGGFAGEDLNSVLDILADIKGVGWTNETLVKIVADIAAISAGSGATAQEVWEYATRVLTAGTNIDLSALATATDLATVDTVVGAIKAKTDLIPASPAEAGEYTAAIGAVKSVVDDILVDTGTTLDTLVKDIPTNAELATALGTADDAVLAAVAAAKAVIDDLHDTDIPAIPTAAEVWSSPIRTLTVPAVVASSNVDGTTLSLYKDADINIEFTGLTIPAGSKKVVFTIKDNLDDADTASALQATYQLVAPSTETHTLNYINSAVPTGLTNPVTFTVDTDSVEFDMTAAAAYYLPRYERGYLHWDLKLITATTVQILQQGLVQILGTSTRAVA